MIVGGFTINYNKTSDNFGDNYTYSPEESNENSYNYSHAIMDSNLVWTNGSDITITIDTTDSPSGSVTYYTDGSKTGFNPNGLIQQPGNYYIEVASSSEWTDTQYSLSINKNEIQKISEIEPNDDFSNANDVNLDKVYTGNIGNNTDQDFFSFSIENPSIVNLSLNTNVESNLNYYLVEIYDNEFNRLFSDVTGKDKVFEINLDQSGQYYFSLQNDDYFSSEDYSFVINAFDSTPEINPDPNPEPDDPPVQIVPDNLYNVSKPIDTNSDENAIAENAVNGTFVGITAYAEDLDTVNNSVSYSLSDNSNGRFAINETSGVVTLSNGSLVDYETNTSHMITVQALSSDGSTNAQSFTIDVLDDASDNNDYTISKPIDTNSDENAIAENAVNGTFVGITAYAEDLDTVNNSVSYSLSDNSNGRFAINETSGVVTLSNGSLVDYETNTSHMITVQALSSDGSTNAQSFTIDVLDDASDNNDYTISKPIDTNSDENAIAENAVNGTFVGITAYAEDLDTVNNSVSYSLSDNSNGRFAINETSGVVTLSNGSLVDYETNTSHMITVQALSSDGSTNAQSFTIDVLDDASDNNDYTISKPIDTNSDENAIAENAVNGTFVGITAYAEDLDTVNNSVSYSLSDNSNGRFAINETSGVVTLSNGSLVDYETNTSHMITVQALSSDGSTNAQSFTIDVLDDASDNNDYTISKPIDTNSDENAIAENAVNGTFVGITAYAEDLDTVNNSVSYSLSDNSNGRFAINETSGVVTLSNGSLVDYETNTSHMITVQALSSDGSTNAQSFTIDVLDDASDNSTVVIGTIYNDVLLGTENDDEFLYEGGSDIFKGFNGNDEITINDSISNFNWNIIDDILSVKPSEYFNKYGDVILRAEDVELVSFYNGQIETGLINSDENIIFGTTSDDNLIATNANERIDGIGGEDKIDGGFGDDTLYIFENEKNVQIDTLNGLTRIISLEESSEYYAQPSKVFGIEKIKLLDNEVEISKSTVNSNDKFFDHYGFYENTLILGDKTDDQINGTHLDEIIDGGGGSDVIDGGEGDDTLLIFENYETVNLDGTGNGYRLSFDHLNNEYSNASIDLINIEKIQFLDQTIDLKLENPIDISISNKTILENGDSSSLSIKLNKQPVEQVLINVNDPSGLLSLDKISLVFDETNWDVVQTIDLSLTNDEVISGDKITSLEINSFSNDPLYNTVINTNDIFGSINIVDDDTSLSISGRIWNDFNKNSNFDITENYFSNIEVFIDQNNNGEFDSFESETISDSNGYFEFTELDPGQYKIGLNLGYGQVMTFPNHDFVFSSSTNSSSNSLEKNIIDDSFILSSYPIGSSNLTEPLSFGFANSDFSHVDGTGQTIVIIDSGIDLDHPAFGPDNNGDGVSDRIIAYESFVPGETVDDIITTDHGSHVAGIAASSNDKFTGVAPGADIIALKVFPSGNQPASPGAIEKALQWSIENADRYSIDVINMSIGNNLYTQDKIDDSTVFIDFLPDYDEVQTLNDLGIITVNSAGNEYRDVGGYLLSSDSFNMSEITSNSYQGITLRAAYDGVISVGATVLNAENPGGANEYFDLNYNPEFWNELIPDDSIFWFSNRDAEQLDLMAPGGFITSASGDGQYYVQQGTSMASPYVAGGIALMQQIAEEQLNRKLTVEEIESILANNSLSVYDGDNENVYQYLDVTPSYKNYNFIDLNAYAEAISEFKDPSFYYVNLENETKRDIDFGVTSNLINNYSSSSENIFIHEAYAQTFAGAGDDIVYGSSGPDIIQGGIGNDQIFSSDGNDEVSASFGNDYIDGGEGQDTLITLGSLSEYNITVSGEEILIQDQRFGRDGTDKIFNFEEIQFSDSILNFFKGGVR